MLFFKRIFKKKLPEKRVEKKSEKKVVKKAKERVIEGQRVKKELEEKDVKKPEAEKKVEQKLPVSREQKPVQKLSKKATRIAPNILIRPIVTEKATFGEAKGLYTFEIAPHANKILVKQAIGELYNVYPVKVNIIRRKGKQVRYGRSKGRTKDRKRAIVYLKQGDKLHLVQKF